MKLSHPANKAKIVKIVDGVPCRIRLEDCHENTGRRVHVMEKEREESLRKSLSIVLLQRRSSFCLSFCR